MAIPIEFKSADDCMRPAQAPGSRMQEWSRRRDAQMLRKALVMAGDPGLVLDLPCGKGLHWPVMVEKANRVVIAADQTLEALEQAWAVHPAQLLKQIRPLQSSAFAIDLSDSAVDSLVSLNWLQSVGDPDDRLQILREFYRVTRETVIVSLWIDGNFNAWRRQRGEHRRRAAGEMSPEPQRFVVARSVIEAEFRAAGFMIERRLDFAMLCAMPRLYVLRKPWK